MIEWQKYFRYDETSPSFLRRMTDCYAGKNNKILKHSVGDVAGNNTSTHGYWTVSIKNKQYLAHRVIWEMFHNEEIPKENHIDHIDGDKCNNCISNLRSVPKRINWRNCLKPKNNTSGVSGVNLKKNTRPSGGKNDYWVASWADLEGNRREKNFSITKLGYDEAFRLACEYRKKMIEELNALGAGYTERHGT